MDPTATCKLIVYFLMQGDFDAANDSAQDLVNWINNGGFMPAQGYLEAIAEIIADSNEPIDGFQGLEILLWNTQELYR